MKAVFEVVLAVPFPYNWMSGRKPSVGSELAISVYLGIVDLLLVGMYIATKEMRP